jgi:hypothetical protein
MTTNRKQFGANRIAFLFCAPSFGVASRYTVAKSEALASQQSGSQAGGLLLPPT